MSEQKTKEKIEDISQEKIENIENAENIQDIPENLKNRYKNVHNKKPSIIGKTIGIIGKIIGALILVALIVIIVRALVFKKYDVFGHRFYLILSGSMEPTIHMGDAVIIKEVEEVKQGDVVAFEKGGAITVHRIIKENEEGDKKTYQTQGDANNTPDKEEITQENIVGVVVAKIMGVGSIILFIQRNLIIIIGVIIILTLLVLARRLM